MTAKVKERLLRWNELCREILSSTGIDTDEDEDTRFTRIATLEADPEEWFKYYFPRFAYAPPAGFHKAATKRILENPEWYEVRIWSRELAKSTRTMMEVLYLILVGHLSSEVSRDEHVTPPSPSEFPQGRSVARGEHATPPSPPAERVGVRSKKHYVLLISNSLDNAMRLLMPYRANLECNLRIICDYGLQEGADKWQAAEFTTIDGASFRALGAGQSPRGARNEEVRPDVIIFDDIDTDADCLNSEIVAQKWRWIEEAAIGTRSVSQPTTIIFCGNRIAVDSCIERASRLADHVDEVNIRDDTGRSTWPQKNSEVDIDRVLSQKSYAAQQKEYFNNPLTEGAVFKTMAYKPARHLREYSMLVCYTDPSYKDTADYKATVLVGKWQNEYHVIKCYLEQTTTAQMIDWHYRIMDMVGNSACYYCMEEGFMQDVIRKEVSDAGKKRGRSIPIRGDTRRKPDKFMRIESLLEPLLRNGELYLNEYEKDNPHMQRLAEQFIAFAPGSRAHDDGPDAVEGAIWTINDKLAKGITGGVVTTPRPSAHRQY